MESQNIKAPHVPIRMLLNVLDDLRRCSIKSTNSPEQKQMLGLTVRQGSAISQVKLLMDEQPEGIALKTLAKYLQMTVPATSLLVEAMVSKGFFERNTNPNDRRAVCIRLSPKGLDLFYQVYSHFHNSIDQLASDLSDEEVETLSKIAQKMHDRHYGKKS